MDVKSHNQLWFEALYQGINHAQKLQITDEKLELYQEFVFNHYYDALIKMFGRINFFIEPDWQEITNRYLENVNAIAWDLNDFCLSFPIFFKEHYPQYPEYIYELVEYEIAEFFIYKELNLNHIKSLQLNPVHRLLIFNFDIAEWVNKAEKTNDDKSFPKAEQNALVIARNNETLLPVFSKLNPLAMAIYNELSERTYSSQKELLEVISSKYNIEKNEVHHIQSTIDSMIKNSIIVEQKTSA